MTGTGTATAATVRAVPATGGIGIDSAAPHAAGGCARAPVDDGDGAEPAVGGAEPAGGGIIDIPEWNAEWCVAGAGGGSIDIPEWNAEWCMEDITHFRTTQLWPELMGWVKGKLATPARQALSVHNDGLPDTKVLGAEWLVVDGVWVGKFHSRPSRWRSRAC